MSSYRLLFLIAISTTIICQSCTYGGPARSFASVVASRAAKIPRSIRAPFRNTEMMTARGFGKRSQHTGKFKDGTKIWVLFLLLILHSIPVFISITLQTKITNISGAESPWTFGKRETKFLDDLGALEAGDAYEQMFNEQGIER